MLDFDFDTSLASLFLLYLAVVYYYLFIILGMNDVKVATMIFNDIYQFKYNFLCRINILFTKPTLDQHI